MSAITVRQWFRGMRRPSWGVELACTIDRMLVEPHKTEMVYGVVLVHDLAHYQKWERMRELMPDSQWFGL